MTYLHGRPAGLLRSLRLAAMKRLPSHLRVRAATERLDDIRFLDHQWACTERVELLRMLGATIGEGVKIKAGVFFDFPHRLIVGSNVSFQHFCFVSCYGGLEIGDDVSIGNGVSIVTSAHPYRNHAVIREARLESAPVRIGSNVWIGMKASILQGVVIGSDVVVGAHSLVTKSIPSNSISVGVPAHVSGKVKDE
jgi:acetyltransferase-like isoleucine patch superfamily enzyme